MEQNEFNQQLPNVSNTPAPNGAFDPQDINNNKVMAILAYFGILVLVPLFAAKESPFARFHTNQGMILFVALICLWVINMIVGAIFGLSTFTGIVSIIISVCYLCIGVLAIIGIINAAQGKAKELPLVGNISIIK